ncbi:hypothetical protein A2635_05540 [Candidatus Peribacteria bacterium RIFCSPHIGHO2_01_FULL_51_9]|nr:MAG: hypothetical protein A2635_05540 [Candidatus Peribacteria bacterium RIFCSPHIGHO2_01_FULL_51_9]
MKASIIIRAYNAEATLTRAVESALAQDFPSGEFEIIIVDDGSTDGTAHIVDQYMQHSRIHIMHQANIGATGAANVGFKAARGEYIGLLDSDDFFEPEFLAETVAVLEQDTAIDMVYTDYFEEIDSVRRVVELQDLFQTIADNTVYRRLSLREEAWWSTEALLFPEYELLLRTLGRWHCARIAKPLLTYVRRKESLTGDAARVEASMKALREKYPQHQTEIDRIRSYALS